MNITPNLALVYDRRHRADKKKEAPVELRVTYQRNSKFVQTGVRLLPRHWKHGQVVDRPDAMQLNETLSIVMTNVRQVINNMLGEGKFSLEELPARLKRSLGERRSFIDFVRERTKVRSYGKKGDTLQRYQRFLKWFEENGGMQFFSDVTETAIIAMDEKLAASGMKNYSKWQNYHRFLNSYILDAIDEGLIKRNPYRWVHIPKDKTSGLKKFLTADELARIERSIMPTKSLEQVRDLFLFQTYTCLSYTDLMAFDSSCIGKEDRVYTARRGKTGQEFTFYIVDKARAILKKYDGKLPAISNVKYNEYLKVVAQTAGIDKPITTHWARHTGATLLLNMGVDMEVIAKILGHSSTRQTRDTYAKMLDDTVAREMQRVGMGKL